MLTTALLSLALATVVFLVKRVEIPFLSLFGKPGDSAIASCLNHLCGKLCSPSLTVDQHRTSHHYYVLHSRCSHLSQGLSWRDCPNTIPLIALNPLEVIQWHSKHVLIPQPPAISVNQRVVHSGSDLIFLLSKKEAPSSWSIQLLQLTASLEYIVDSQTSPQPNPSMVL